jgi:hypothetical protein
MYRVGIHASCFGPREIDLALPTPNGSCTALPVSLRCAFTADMDRKVMGSPDRCDALVWRLTDLSENALAGGAKPFFGSLPTTAVQGFRTGTHSKGGASELAHRGHEWAR